MTWCLHGSVCCRVISKGERCEFLTVTLSAVQLSEFKISHAEGNDFFQVWDYTNRADFKCFCALHRAGMSEIQSG